MNESYVFKLISLFQKRKTSSSSEHQTKRQIQNYRNNDNGTSMLLQENRKSKARVFKWWQSSQNSDNSLQDKHRILYFK